MIKKEIAGYACTDVVTSIWGANILPRIEPLGEQAGRGRKKVKGVKP